MLILLAIPSIGQALVDMRNANYTHHWTDIKVFTTGFDLSVVRTYNSRSLYDGMFGFGWCTLYETTIEITAEGNVELTECGGGLGIIYRPKGFSLAEVKTTVSRILAAYKSENKNIQPDELSRLELELTESESARADKARKYKIAQPIKEGVTYYAEGRRVEYFEKKNNVFYRYLEDGSAQKFDSAGLLTGMQDREGKYLQISRTQGLIQEITDDQGRKLNFKYHPNRKVKSVTGPEGLNAEYKFSKNDLVEVKNGWGNTYKYEYNGAHNMTKVAYPDNTTKEITYNDKKDWVMSFKDRQGCVENYEYQVSGDSPKDHYWSSVVKKCGAKVTNRSRYEFWHKNREDGRGKYLHRVVFRINDAETEMTFHPQLGDPLMVRKTLYAKKPEGKNSGKGRAQAAEDKKEEIIHYSYFDNGLLKSRKDSVGHSEYEYNTAFHKVSVVKTKFLDPKGKVLKMRTTDFQYNNLGNLEIAKNSDGQQVWLSYDERGRIARIRDQAKKVVEITYEERFGKPSTVNRPGVGEISIYYNENGDMRDVKSKAGPIVAQEVASTFNNLLEIITPGAGQMML